ncbi:class I SAM-dependent methyltransferase [Candidatus Frankia alpina]|uniref:Class I SAM-dependent methyltransferase n=1 Tax=Candidatus Frankia alpina TaxID=2699483 RepID=A0A4S5D0G2_9ACTN|nr:class I SAM-dependent methyltransferase [Candidatus Frankia alpina]THJ50825.1 class I SAM-dependent methyltransferase [Candidatus Frankia alpina]
MAGDLFSGTAGYYARYRPCYPPEFLADVARRFSLPGTGRLLDLGCGPGTLTLALAARMREVIGVDPEPEMLAEAAQQADRAGVRNVRWVAAAAENLPSDLGRFQLVTMGRSFHWMDRDQVLATVAGMVTPTGGFVIVSDYGLDRPATDWQRAIEQTQAKFLGTVRRAGSGVVVPTMESHEIVAKRSPFRRVERILYEFERRWTIEQVIGYLYSTSFQVRGLLGARRTAFEEEITEALRVCSPDNKFVEPVQLTAVFASLGT